jgi:hypothetical protein
MTTLEQSGKTPNSKGLEFTLSGRNPNHAQHGLSSLSRNTLHALTKHCSI